MINAFSLNRPHWAKSVIESPCLSVCLFVFLCVCAIGCRIFLGLSLALRSYDQFLASHCLPPLTPPPKPPPPPPQKNIIGIGASIRIGYKIQSLPYAGLKKKPDVKKITPKYAGIVNQRNFHCKAF